MYAVPFSYRYTTASAYSSQGTPENSIGGFISTNTVYTATTISSSVSRLATTVPVVSVPSAASGLAQVDIEVVDYAAIDIANSQLSSVERGQVPKCSFPHGVNPVEGAVRYLTVGNLFDPKFDSSHEQYRCISIKNLSSISVENVEVILINDVDSFVEIDIGIEVPFHDYRTSSISNVTSNLMFVDSSLAGTFANNYFDGSALRMTSGAASGSNSIISSYDGMTGTFVLTSAIASIAVGDTFEIEAAPSQIVINQLTKPTLNSGLFFGFLGEGGSNELAHGNMRESSNVFRSNDVFYLWIQRTLPRNMKSRSNTAAVILVSYVESGS